MLLDPLLLRQVVSIRMVFAPLCEGTFKRDTEDYKGKREDVDESIREAFHKGAAIVVGTCGRHCVRIRGFGL